MGIAVVIAMGYMHRCRLVATAGRLRLKSIEVRQGDSQWYRPIGSIGSIAFCWDAMHRYRAPPPC